jgi:arylsulfatase A-like enzyme
MRRKKDGAFLVYFPITLVHTPHPPTPRTKGQELAPIDNFRENLRYADHCIGRVVAALSELKLRERTIVFVTADNGGPPSFPARTERGVVTGRMGSFTEPSLDMPLIVNSPTLIPAGRTATLTDFSDFFPTIAALARAPLPRRPGRRSQHIPETAVSLCFATKARGTAWRRS